MRLYIPATSSLVTHLLSDGAITVERGFAVTPELRQWHRESSGSDDLEELEYIAATMAAEASLALLEEDASAVPRRLVLAVELAAGISPVDDGALGEVLAGVPIRREQVEAALVDGPEAESLIASVLDAAKDGQDADPVDLELMWFAAGELAYLF